MASICVEESSKGSVGELKVKTTFSFAGVKLTEGKFQVNEAADTAKGIYLKTSQGDTIGQSSAILRYVAKLVPYANLYGPGDRYTKALVDQWLDFVWADIDVPNSALAMAEEGEIKKSIESDISKSLSIVDSHLVSNTYLACNYITISDISLACSIRSLGPLPSTTPNLSRWYNTISNHPKIAPLFGVSTSSASGEQIQANVDRGLQLSGVPPPVRESLYKRGRIRIKELLSTPSLIGSTVTVSGWARTTRNADAGKLLFVELNDGSTTLSVQCVMKNTSTGFDNCKASGGTGASFTFTGELVESEGKGQKCEIQVIKGECVGPVYGGNDMTIGGANYPLAKKGHSLEHLREHAHLRPRAKVHAAAMRIRHAMAFATHKFFNDNGFLYIHTPIVTCADCEGAGEQFGITTLFGTDPHKTDVKIPYVEEEDTKEGEAKEAGAEGGEGGKGLSNKAKKKAAKKAAALAKKAAMAASKGGKPAEDKLPVGAVDYNKDFFGKRANLTVSGQLNVETHCCALSDVYTFGPTFRAENSHTSRHLAEFWMIEPEIAFADLHTDMDLAEDYIKYCVQYALECCRDDLNFFEESQYGEKGLIKRLENVIEAPFKRLTYTEGIELLKKTVAEGHTFEESDIQWGMDLGSEHERYLCETIFKKPVILTDYPKDIKAFYMKLNADEKTVAAADILVPKIGELVGGSQREHRHDVLVERCKAQGLEPKAIWWYLELRKFGTMPHAGFGLGFERLILFITGLENIRDVIPFPRTPGVADF